MLTIRARFTVGPWVLREIDLTPALAIALLLTVAALIGRYSSWS
jgi:hypothetical protein